MRSKRSLICPKHGARSMIISELKPGGPHFADAICGHPGCRHSRSLTEKQAVYLLRSYRYMRTIDYVPSPYDILFEESTTK